MPHNLKPHLGESIDTRNWNSLLTSQFPTHQLTSVICCVRRKPFCKWPNSCLWHGKQISSHGLSSHCMVQWSWRKRMMLPSPWQHESLGCGCLPCSQLMEHTWIMPPMNRTGSDRACLTHVVTARWSPHLFCVLPTQICIKRPTRCFELRTKIHPFKEMGSELEMHLMTSWGCALVCVFIRFGVMSLCFEGILMRAVTNGELPDFVQLLSIISSDSYMRNLWLYLKRLFVTLNPLFHRRHCLSCFSWRSDNVQLYLGLCNSFGEI